MDHGDEPLDFAVLKIEPDVKNRSKKRQFAHLDLSKVDTTEYQRLLGNARAIQDINSVSYPEGVLAPIPALNQNAREGKFRYDRDFLLQFMTICSDRPASLPSLDTLGLRPLGTPKSARNNFRTSGCTPGRSPPAGTRSFPPNSASDSVPLHGFTRTGRSENRNRSWNRRHSVDSDHKSGQVLPTDDSTLLTMPSPGLNPAAPTFTPKRKMIPENQRGEELFANQLYDRPSLPAKQIPSEGSGYKKSEFYLRGFTNNFSLPEFAVKPWNSIVPDTEVTVEALSGLVTFLDQISARLSTSSPDEVCGQDPDRECNMEDKEKQEKERAKNEMAKEAKVECLHLDREVAKRPAAAAGLSADVQLEKEEAKIDATPAATQDGLRTNYKRHPRNLDLTKGKTDSLTTFVSTDSTPNDKVEYTVTRGRFAHYDLPKVGHQSALATARAPSDIPNPATRTMVHNPVHPPIPPRTPTQPSNSMGGIPPATLSALTTIPAGKSLNTSASAFVPGKPVTVTLKNAKGVAITNVGVSVASSAFAGPRHGSPGTSGRQPASVRIESEDQRKQRLAEETEKERQKAEAEEKIKREKELAERKVKEEEERKKQEEEEKERLRKEEEECQCRAAEREERERLKSQPSTMPPPPQQMPPPHLQSQLPPMAWPSYYYDQTYMYQYYPMPMQAQHQPPPQIKIKREKELAERKVKEEEKRKKREEEEKERLREEEEEKARRRKEEEERLKREAEEREAQRIKEEEERQRRAEEAQRIAEEKARKEEEARLQREKEAKEKAEREERERLERERAEKEKAEQERLAKEAEAERLRLEQEEAERKAASEALADARPEKEEGEVDEDNDPSSPSAAQDGRDKVKETLRISTNFRRHPGNLDLTDAKKANIPAPQSALATARVISDINAVTYPEGVSSPNPALNQNAKEGKFRYDREFLLQFMPICEEKPASLPPLDAIGIEPLDSSSLHLSRGGSGRRRTSSSALPPARQASMGLGLSSGPLGKGTSSPFHLMGKFATGRGSKLSNEDRFAASSRTVSGPGMPFPRPGLTHTASTGGPNLTKERTRSKRGEKRNDTNKVANIAQNQAMAAHHQQLYAPLQITANRWDRMAFQANADLSEMVDRKVKSLLNKFTMRKFDSISDQIIEWANESENEKDGQTLIQVIKLVFEKATDEAMWSEMYARLCRKMMEQISPKVQDDGIRNVNGKPIAGGQLFRKYLLNRCQEDFERVWVATEVTAAAATKAIEDEAVKAANEKGDQKDYALYSDEYYAAQKAKRRGLGLIKFIGELFKLQMLTERIMHECVKKLLGNVDNPWEEEIESLCKLLTTVGHSIDTQKARAHMDVYFSRMKELTKNPHVTPRMQFMLQDIIELRERKWRTRQSPVEVDSPDAKAQTLAHLCGRD